MLPLSCLCCWPAKPWALEWLLPFFPSCCCWTIYCLFPFPFIINHCTFLVECYDCASLLCVIKLICVFGSISVVSDPAFGPRSGKQKQKWQSVMKQKLFLDLSSLLYISYIWSIFKNLILVKKGYFLLEWFSLRFTGGNQPPMHINTTQKRPPQGCWSA